MTRMNECFDDPGGEYFNNLLDNRQNLEDLKFDNSRKFVSLSDFFVGKHVVALFQSVGLNIPDVISVAEAEEELSRPALNPKRTFILVGLHSNRISNKILQNKEIQTKLKFRLGDRNPDPPARYLEVKLHSVVDGFDKKLINGNIVDYSVFVRLKYYLSNFQKCNIIIIGGLNATGTEAISRFLYNKWEEIFYPELESCAKKVNIEIDKVEAFSAVYAVTKENAEAKTVSYMSDNISIEPQNLIL